MIYIYESTPTKVSGQTSLYVKFDFNQDIVNALKTMGTFSYDKKTHLWELPVSTLSALLDTLTYLDDIELSLIQETSENAVFSPSTTFKTTPFDYQLEGITYGLNHDKWLLLDAPGLGKTLQTICLAEELHFTRGLKHCMIICGIATLRSNWEKEIKKHSKLDCVVIGKKVNSKGTVVWEKMDKRAEQVKNPIDEFFIIVNIETLRDDKFIEALKKSQNDIDMIIFDECHKCIDGESIVLTDEGSMMIKDIVESGKTNLMVMSDDNEFHFIEEFHRVPSSSVTIEIGVEDTETGHMRTLRCSEDHLIKTKNRGFVQARHLTKEDEIELL